MTRDEVVELLRQHKLAVEATVGEGGARGRAVKAALVAVLALAACGGGERGPRHRAVGTLVHDGVEAGDQVGWETELEILRSQALLDQVGRELAERGVTVPLADVRRGLAVKRRADSRVIEVSVALDDHLLARSVCNLLILAYIERRLGGRAAETDGARKALSAELDRLRADLDTHLVDGHEDPARAKVYEQTLARLRELELVAVTRPRDVVILDACTLAKR